MLSDAEIITPLIRRISRLFVFECTITNFLGPFEIFFECFICFCEKVAFVPTIVSRLAAFRDSAIVVRDK